MHARLTRTSRPTRSLRSGLLLLAAILALVLFAPRATLRPAATSA